MSRNTRTVEMASALALTTSYQTVDFPSGQKAVVASGGQVVLSFKRTNGTSVTFQIEEYLGEAAGWITHVEDDGTNLTALERTSTLAAFQYAFTTLAEKIRVKVKGIGSEELDLLLTVGEVE